MKTVGITHLDQMDIMEIERLSKEENNLKAFQKAFEKTIGEIVFLSTDRVVTYDLVLGLIDYFKNVGIREEREILKQNITNLLLRKN